MDVDFPALRTDLRFVRRETAEGPRFVTKDPISERYFQFREAEYAITKRLNGVTSLTQVATEVSAELGEAIDEAELVSFVEQLGRFGMLQGGQPLRPKRTLLRGTALWLRLKAFDPDPLLNRLLPRVAFCFTPQFLAFSFMLVLLAIAITITNHETILADAARLWRVESLLLAWVTIIAVTVGHEFAHGLTCKHYGGEVHEMGFLLIYFQPAFYCNISDAWLFPKKSQRLWVTFAGAYFEVAVWALATISWRVLEPGTWLSAVALVIMATSGIKLFFNLNPLIKLDGYYLLCDLVDVSNLRSRAFAYISAGTRKLFGFIPRSEFTATPREKRLFVCYGILAMVFSYWLIAMIAFRFADWLTTRYEAWGFMTFAGVLASAYWAPIRRVAFSSKTKLLVLFIGIVVLLYVSSMPLTVSGPVTILPKQNSDVRAGVEGIIDRVYVREGERVHAGDTIARLAERDYRARLRMVDADVATKAAQLALLRSGARREELDLARLAVSKADERLRYARSELRRLDALVQIEAASRVELDKANEHVAVRIKELEEARGTLGLLRAGNRPEQIAAVEQEMERLTAERDQLQQHLNGLSILAQHAGVITTPHLEERIGEFLKAGDLIAEVLELSTVRAEIQVSEREIGEVRVGQTAHVRLRAYPSKTFKGRVTAIAPAAGNEEARAERTVRVTVALNNSSGLLRPGITGFARVFIGQSRTLDIVTRRLRRFVRVEFWSWW